MNCVEGLSREEQVRLLYKTSKEGAEYVGKGPGAVAIISTGPRLQGECRSGSLKYCVSDSGDVVKKVYHIDWRKRVRK